MSSANPGIVWRTVTPKKPILWPRNEKETWMMTPPTRYVVTSDQQEALDDNLESWSDLKTTTHYKPLFGSQNLANSRILMARHWDRGIGDMLFMTGPVAYMQHLNLHSVQFYWYAPADKGQVLHGNTALKFDMPLTGPIIYDTFPQFYRHWFVESVTEYDEEPEQENVYDVLYKQLGVDPATVSSSFKRPYVFSTVADQKKTDEFFRLIYVERREDWRTKKFWVVSPLTHSTLRTMSYVQWLSIIEELGKTTPVLVTGNAPNNLMPFSEISYSEFHARISAISQRMPNVINLIGRVPLRLTMGLVRAAEGVITMDSGLLYIAEGLRIPAISIWGPQSPQTRIGYDKDYMELAIWKREACSASPCFAYRAFPAHKCPRQDQQKVCEPFYAVTVNDIMQKVEKVRSKV